MDSIFNNREISTAIWLMVFAIWAITKSGVRAALRNLIRSFLKWQILVPLLAMIVYIALMVWGLSATGFWDASAIKITVLWVFGSALIMLFLANEAQKKEGFFRKAILNNLTLIAVLEFVLNVYTFSLWIELLLVPSLTLIVMLKTVAELRVKVESSYKVVDSLLGYVLAFIGLGLLSLTICQVINYPDRFLTIYNMRDFLLPVVLSSLFLPFLYIWALILTYEKIFVLINIFNEDRKLARYFKWLVLLNFHFRLWRLMKWRQQVSIRHVNSREDVVNLVKQSANKE